MRRLIVDTIQSKDRQGYDVADAWSMLDGARGFDDLLSIVGFLSEARLRADWPYVEPDGLAEIRAESDFPDGVAGPGDIQGDVRERIKASFIASVAGCILGKPLEVQATFDELRDAALRSSTPWPLDGYVPEAMLDSLGRRSRDWSRAVAGRITYVPPDDDVNFRILALLLLERRGRSFTGTDLVDLWSNTLPIEWVWASNRTLVLKAGLHWWRPGDDPLPPAPLDEWRATLNPYEEDCGAVIRVDPYAYAAPGRPWEAAELAWRDASVTHHRTGVYAAMFQAASLAAAFATSDPIEVFEFGLACIPRRSRLYEAIAEQLEIVRHAKHWESGYRRLEAAYGEFGHCQLIFELGTVMNTVRFATSVGEGLGLQVSQGLDTDSFGASAGSVLGAMHVQGLAGSWTDPFQDDLRTSVANFHERSLARVSERMAALPAVGESGTGIPAFASDA